MSDHDDEVQDRTRTAPGTELPEALVDRLLQPVVRFLHVEAASGLVLLGCTVVALVLANSAWAEDFAALWQTPVRVGVGAFELNKPLLLWINDGLMTIFFFVVGLEIKRELIHGELRDIRKAALPASAALGGMIVPALIYFGMQQGTPAESGWGIPMATDIAFVVGLLALLGSRVPHGLKVLLLSLAIVDDIGAVLVIAAFYTEKVLLGALGVAGAGFLVVSLFNRLGVRRVPVYVVLGAGIWLAVLKSGVHPTVAGVLLGLMTPASAWVGDRSLMEALAGMLGRLGDGHADEQVEQKGKIEFAVRESVSPLERLENALHPWVAYLIMPVFALANAGVAIDASRATDPVALAIAGGLLVGKPVGILLFSLAAVWLGVARLPDGINWAVLIGAGFLAGIGFTMSLFIAGLALEPSLLAAGKVGILTGSALSALIGAGLLLFFLNKATGRGK
jgi:Na+:H+ antiporter, NhaA family